MTASFDTVPISSIIGTTGEERCQSCEGKADFSVIVFFGGEPEYLEYACESHLDDLIGILEVRENG